MLFSERLRELRQNKGLSQSQLADALNISKSAISMYELGKREPDLETLEGIADFFNVDINYLIGKEDGSMYYLDPEAAEIAQEVQQRPELKILFDASRKVSADDLRFVIDMIDRLKKNEVRYEESQQIAEDFKEEDGVDPSSIVFPGSAYLDDDRPCTSPFKKMGALKYENK